jgi:hypothetical protein
MKKLLLSAAFVCFGSIAMAGIATDQLVASFQSAGYTHIEIKTGVTQMKVEAVSGTTKVEVIYDIATGAIIKQETSTVGALENTAPGVEVKSVGKDFTNSDGSDDSASGDDSSDDNGVDGTDDSNDDNGMDDSNDDHGSDDSSDDSGDDNGNSGSDSHGNSGHGSSNDND